MEGEQLGLSHLRRTCLLKLVIEGNVEWKRRRGRRSTQLYDNRKEKRRHLNLKEEERDCTVWRTCFGRGHNPVATQATQ
jgi:hypothetical protein